MAKGDIIEGPIGAVGSYDVEFKDGKLVAKVGAEHEPLKGVTVKADVSVELGAEAVIDAIARAIPGEVDDFVLDKLKKALLAA